MAKSEAQISAHPAIQPTKAEPTRFSCAISTSLMPASARCDVHPGPAGFSGSLIVAEFASLADAQAWAKAETADAARAQLMALRGKSHRLFSAVVLYEQAKPVWRHVEEASLTMRSFSDGFLDDYIARNWDDIRHSVGAYQLEREGARLFAAVDGNHFTILGLPMLPLLKALREFGAVND